MEDVVVEEGVVAAQPMGAKNKPVDPDVSKST